MISIWVREEAGLLAQIEGKSYFYVGEKGPRTELHIHT